MNVTLLGRSGDVRVIMTTSLARPRYIHPWMTKMGPQRTLYYVQCLQGWALVILRVWRHSRLRLSLPVKLSYSFTLDFWEDMTYCSIYYALFASLQTKLHFKTFLILHVTVVGYAVMVYCVAVDCKSKTTYTGRPVSLAGPSQPIKPWLRRL